MAKFEELRNRQSVDQKKRAKERLKELRELLEVIEENRKKNRDK